MTETFAKELKEDEEMVLKVLEARHGREEMARINAREVRRAPHWTYLIPLSLLLCPRNSGC
jgi:hypothetical protein